MAVNSKTLFVLGAGASKEIGFPTGAELKHKLAARLNIRFPDGWTQSSGDPAITDALRSVVEGPKGRGGDINRYLDKTRRMVAALPLALSIDNYIDAQEDDDIAFLGKLAVVREIAECEKNSAIYFKEVSDVPAMLGRVTSTHYHGLFQLLTEGLRKSNVEDIFENVSFISFNYDRSLEWYLQHAIQNFFSLDDSRTKEVMSRLQVIHPYGTIGSLPAVARQNNAVRFGISGRDDYVDLAKGIRTFTEQISDEALSLAIDIEVKSAVRMVFLGFGYHDINMQTLATTGKTNLRQVIGTAYGFSESDIDTIKSSVVASFSSVASNPTFYSSERVSLRSDLKCAAIFDEYGRTLRQ
ncbi:hypothetical protein [Devosia sp. 2618]|uniref:hypothetical protein n=1 Tax=Devosia sp. 2618 TaxID=3156454 RepID=UPI003395111F